MLDPPIMVYDEPTSGLDPPMSRQVDDLIEEVRERFGVTSIVSSHDITSCFRLAHQAILLMDGEIIARGSPDELAEGSDDRARRFIAASGVDVGHVSRVRSGTFARVSLPTSGRDFAGAAE
jgi:phospholipid/cholesterol/gamma-HCH transport system ATP-binding protein